MGGGTVRVVTCLVAFFVLGSLVSPLRELHPALELSAKILVFSYVGNKYRDKLVFTERNEEMLPNQIDLESRETESLVTGVSEARCPTCDNVVLVKEHKRPGEVSEKVGKCGECGEVLDEYTEYGTIAC
jgi:DNA-directed RNA polymerase subunit RPC12/RpoP